MTIVVKRPKLTSPFVSVTIKRHGDRINVNGPQKVNYCNFNSISPNISNRKLNISQKSSVGSSLNSPYDSEVKLLDRWWDDGEKTEGQGHLDIGEVTPLADRREQQERISEEKTSY